MQSCKNGKKLQENKDICLGAHLVYIDKTRKDKEFTVSNNRFACAKCTDYLSNEERTICKKVK